MKFITDIILLIKSLPRGHVAEIEFWGMAKYNKEIKLSEGLIGNQGRYGTTIANAFDGSLLSYYLPKDKEQTYIGIDLGEGKQTRITKNQVLSP